MERRIRGEGRARARLGEIQVEQHHRAEYRPAFELAAAVEIGEVGETAGAIELDVFGAGRRRHGGAGAGEVRFQGPEMAAVAEKVEDEDDHEHGDDECGPADALEPGLQRCTPLCVCPRRGPRGKHSL